AQPEVGRGSLEHVALDTCPTLVIELVPIIVMEGGVPAKRLGLHRTAIHVQGSQHLLHHLLVRALHAEGKAHALTDFQEPLLIEKRIDTNARVVLAHHWSPLGVTRWGWLFPPRSASPYISP